MDTVPHDKKLMLHRRGAVLVLSALSSAVLHPRQSSLPPWMLLIRAWPQAWKHRHLCSAPRRLLARVATPQGSVSRAGTSSLARRSPPGGPASRPLKLIDPVPITLPRRSAAAIAALVLLPPLALSGRPQPQPSPHTGITRRTRAPPPIPRRRQASPLPESGLSAGSHG